jgi:hypothetical protein
MPFIVGAVVTAVVAVIFITRRVPGGVSAGNLGHVSERWLADHRASHPS